MNDPLHTLPIAKAETLRTGSDVAILAIGSMVVPAERAADILAEHGIRATVVNARFVKPLDESLIADLARTCHAVVTVEENVGMGGFGAGVLEVLAARGIQVPVRVLAIPDRVFEQASQARLREMAGLTPADIAAAAQELLEGAHRAGKRSAHAAGLAGRAGD